ncbi:hypothetical protein RHMOL_Rhmol08G0079500 [Rhododendron molle]|uniref:Uncharacterized protein n=1 Tax=Rhododendron molle TaxID=49168 RepID=A0ACC0MM55_RHOML|nr:hypothetical protein RHMOL_Rhmol08G0079500 [Rhododendron molle]
MSTSGQHQFRYTQTPSKVLHLRNLPWECIEEELVELCKPFGKIVNTRCNVGANHNQAFVEFADLNQAINMATYFASSSEPAQVRGKTVYIQYSNRHEVVNNKGPGDVPGNVLLATIEGVEAGDVSIDVIHLVFSAFGFVHKVATFEKAAGFQMLYNHVGLHFHFNLKFPLDYTNPYLPVNPSAIEGFVQPAVGPDGKIKEPESNVLLASIENMQYVVTVDVLHTVFSAFGTVQKIAIFEKNGGTQALIQYPDITTAAVAKDAIEGHCIYDGGYCKLHLSYSRHTDLNVKAFSDKSRDYTIPNSTVWQNSQTASMFPGNEFSGGGAGPTWYPNTQADRPPFVSGPSTFPGQTYSQSSVPAYAAAAPADFSVMQPGQISGASQPPRQQNMGPGGASHPGQPPYNG